MAATGFIGTKSFLSISPVTGIILEVGADAALPPDGAAAATGAVGGPACHSEKPLALIIN